MKPVEIQPISLEEAYEAFDQRSEDEKMLWSYGNSILYQMCETNPLHCDKEVVVGKVWLIGRSYAAAIERSAESQFKGDEFYLREVAPEMVRIGVQLDRRIEAINTLCESHATRSELMCQVVQTHKYLMDCFHEITKKNNRSLASKYLHFHCPDAFYIFDTRAADMLTKWVKAKDADKDILVNLSDAKRDNEYAAFVCKAMTLNRKLEEIAGRSLSPRDIDDFLIWSSSLKTTFN